jgi:hypothetical protein
LEKLVDFGGVVVNLTLAHFFDEWRLHNNTTSSLSKSMTMARTVILRRNFNFLAIMN